MLNRVTTLMLVIVMLTVAGTAYAELAGRKSGEDDLTYYKRIFARGTQVVAKYPSKPTPLTGIASLLAADEGLTSFFKDKYYYRGVVADEPVIKEVPALIFTGGKLKPGAKVKVVCVFIEYEDGDKSWLTVSGKTISVFQPFSRLNQVEKDSFYTKKVLARYNDSGYQAKFWYRGTITLPDPKDPKRDKTKYKVNYEDGDTKWHNNMDTISAIAP